MENYKAGLKRKIEESELEGLEGEPLKKHLSGFTIPQLNELLVKYQLKKKGTKELLIERIMGRLKKEPKEEVYEADVEEGTTKTKPTAVRSCNIVPNHFSFSRSGAFNGVFAEDLSFELPSLNAQIKIELEAKHETIKFIPIPNDGKKLVDVPFTSFRTNSWHRKKVTPSKILSHSMF